MCVDCEEQDRCVCVCVCVAGQVCVCVCVEQDRCSGANPCLGTRIQSFQKNDRESGDLHTGPSDRGSSTELQKHTLKLLLHQPDQDGQAVHMATTPPLLQHPLRTEKWPTPSQAKGFTASNTPVLY